MDLWQTENSGDAALDLLTNEETRDALQSQISKDEEKQAGVPLALFDGRCHMCQAISASGKVPIFGHELMDTFSFVSSTNKRTSNQIQLMERVSRCQMQLSIFPSTDDWDRLSPKEM